MLIVYCYPQSTPVQPPPFQILHRKTSKINRFYLNNLKYLKTLSLRTKRSHTNEKTSPFSGCACSPPPSPSSFCSRLSFRATSRRNSSLLREYLLRRLTVSFGVFLCRQDLYVTDNSESCIVFLQNCKSERRAAPIGSKHSRQTGVDRSHQALRACQQTKGELICVLPHPRDLLLAHEILA